MKWLWLVIGAITAGVALSAPSHSRPYPDRTGVCYFFRGETPELTEPCVISTGYGAGSHYAALRWSDGVVTRIFMINSCPVDGYDAHGFCKYTVDDESAAFYFRDVFMGVTSSTDPENMSCWRVLESGNSICYRFN